MRANTAFESTEKRGWFIPSHQIQYIFFKSLETIMVNESVKTETHVHNVHIGLIPHPSTTAIRGVT